jgi:hypothetical protein
MAITGTATVRADGMADGMAGGTADMEVDMEVGEDMAAEAGMVAAEMVPWSDSIRPLIFKGAKEFMLPGVL